MSPTDTAPFHIHAESEGCDPEWLLSHARRHLRNAPASVNDRFEWTLEYNEMLIALHSRAVSGVRVANFKAFGAEPQRLPIAPITLIFGRNNAGKSSLIQSLLYAQHATLENELDVRHPRRCGTAVDLGGFSEILHAHNPEATIQIGFEFNHLFRSAAPDSPPTVWTVAIRNHSDFPEPPELAEKRSRRKEPRIVSASLEIGGREILRFIRVLEKLKCIRADADHPYFARILGGLGRYPLSPVFDEWPADAQREWRTTAAYLASSLEVSLEGLLPDKVDSPLAASERSNSSGTAFGTASLGDDVPLWSPRRAQFLASNLTTKIATMLRHVHDRTKDFLRGLDYLGPTRPGPGRNFDLLNRNDANHGSSGGHAWATLAGLGDVSKQTRERLNRWFDDLAKRKVPDVAHYRFDLVHDLNRNITEEVIERVAHDYLNEEYQAHEKARATRGDDAPNERFYFPFDHLDATELTRRIKSELSERPEAAVNPRLAIRDLGNRTTVSPADIGVGIQALVPVLVETLYGGSALQIIEEPELHAHPGLQAELGDCLTEGALTVSKPPLHRRFIIETHSEHLVLRVLRRIRQSTSNDPDYPKDLPKVRPEDVAVIYVEPSGEGTKLRQLHITPDGDFADPWPHGFFTERGVELFT